MLSEAIAASVPILASRIDGNVGILYASHANTKPDLSKEWLFALPCALTNGAPKLVAQNASSNVYNLGSQAIITTGKKSEEN